MKILDGQYVSKKVKEEIKKETELLEKEINKVPGLAVVQVGDNAASKIYVNSKIKQCSEVGFKSKSFVLPETTTEDEILNIIDELNKDEEIDGILVQLPLPKEIDSLKVIDKIAIEKDVDGFKPENLGKVMLGDKTALVSCTPAGVMEILKEYNLNMNGLDVAIIGRSNIVGKPLNSLMINEGATVTICNSRTKELAKKTREADVVVVAIGNPRFLTKDMVKPGAIVIDVGINRDEENKICGDVDFEKVSEVASHITPVPKGVGPMTIAMLLKNTLKAFKINKNI